MRSATAEAPQEVRPPARRRRRWWVAGAAAAVLVVVLALAVGWRAGEDPDDALVARLRAVPDQPGGAPLVLSYHDVTDRTGDYAVAPATFAATMRLLRDAGYTTVGARELDAWRRGVPLPHHAVVLTFDDGLVSTRSTVDPILAANGQRAVAFVITGFVGSRPGHFVAWGDLAALAATGRWDVESHSHLGHGLLPSGPWLATRRPGETIDGYRARIAADLDASIAALRAHGFATPTLFAYPYNDDGASGPGDVGAVLRDVVGARFLGMAGEPVRAPDRSELARVSVSSGALTPADVVARIEAASPLAVDAIPAPLDRPDLWRDAAGRRARFPAGRLTLDPGTGWAALTFALDRTSTWRDYAVSATLGGSAAADDGTTTGLRVLVGSARPVQVRVSFSGWSVSAGPDLLASGPLAPAASHVVRAEVRGGDVVLAVDGAVVAHVPDTGGSGGVQITGQRTLAGSPSPWANGMTLAALP